MSLQHLIDQVAEGGKIELPARMEYEGPLVIKKGIHIVGNLATLWINTPNQAALEIDTTQKVILENFYVENVVNDGSKSSNGSTAIYIKNMGELLCQKMLVKGNVVGLKDEDGFWNYPYVINIEKMKTNMEHKFKCKLFMPQNYDISTNITDLKINKKLISPYTYEIEFTIGPILKETIFRGLIYVKTNMFVRMIHFNAVFSKDMEAKCYQNEIIFDIDAQLNQQLNEKIANQKQFTASSEDSQQGLSTKSEMLIKGKPLFITHKNTLLDQQTKNPKPPISSTSLFGKITQVNLEESKATESKTENENHSKSAFLSKDKLKITRQDEPSQPSQNQGTNISLLKTQQTNPSPVQNQSTTNHPNVTKNIQKTNASPVQNQSTTNTPSGAKNMQKSIFFGNPKK